MSNTPKCPNCGSKDTSFMNYGFPAQIMCHQCKIEFEDGEIQILGISNAIQIRPSMYKEYLCKKCNKYRILINTKNLTKEDKEILCICDIKENS